MKIIPAILPRTYDELYDDVEQVKSLVSFIQVDICDGHFTSQPTWPYRKHDEHFAAIGREEEGMPFWEDVEFEAHLMVVRPEELFEEWIQAGASRILFHPDATEKIAECIELLEGRVEIGIGIGLDTPFEKFAPFIDKISVIQCMGIAEIGKQGQPFDERVFDVIAKVQDRFPGVPIAVDGGVTKEIAPHLKKAGVDRLVIGSAIFASHNIPGEISYFRSL